MLQEESILLFHFILSGCFLKGKKRSVLQIHRPQKSGGKSSISEVIISPSLDFQVLGDFNKLYLDIIISN